MTIPKLKRVTVTSPQVLRTWLSKRQPQTERVMIVRNDDPSHKNHLSREDVKAALDAHGWTAGPSYTIGGALIGDVTSQTAEGRQMNERTMP